MAFHALVCSKLDYTAPAWQPWLSNANLFCLDRLQNHSLRSITGQLVSTLLEALRLEADVQSYPTCSNHLILNVKEKALQSTDDHPKCVALDVNIPQRLQNSWAFVKKQKNFLLSCHLNFNTDKISYRQQSSSHEEQIATSVPGITGRVDNINLRHQCSLTTIISYHADYVIYTDGSASRGTRNRGADEVVTWGSPLQPEVVTTIKTRGRTFTSSYEEEAAAM